MKDFESLVDIWQAQKTAPDLDYKTILSKNKKSKDKLKLKISLGLLIMIFGLGIIIYLWLKTPFNYITTHLGLIIFLLCGLYYITRQIKNISILSNDSYLKTPKEHIEFIQTFRKMRMKENTQNFLFYTIVMTIGFSLYFIEFFTQVNKAVVYISIGFTILWIALCYFYFQKIYIKKEEKLFAEMIENLDKLKNQFQ